LINESACSVACSCQLPNSSFVCGKKITLTNDELLPYSFLFAISVNLHSHHFVTHSV
jgi:hypothetical protein